VLDVGTLHVGLGVDLSSHWFHVYDDHDFCLLGILSEERQLLWHGEIRSDRRSEKRDGRA